MEGVGGSWQSDLQPYIIDQDRVICVWVFVVWVHVWVYEVLQVVVDCMWWNGPCCFGRLLLLTKTTTHNDHKSYLFKCSILTPAVRLTSYVFVSVCMSVCIHTYSYISIWVCLHVIGGGVWVCRNQQPTTIGNRTDVVLSICFSFSVSQVDCWQWQSYFCFCWFPYDCLDFLFIFRIRIQKTAFYPKTQGRSGKVEFFFSYMYTFFSGASYTSFCVPEFSSICYIFSFESFFFFIHSDVCNISSLFLLFFSIFPCSVWRIYLNSIAPKTKVEISETPRHPSNHQPLWPSSL